MNRQPERRNLRLIGIGLVLVALIVVSAVVVLLWLAPGTLPFLRIDPTWRTMQANRVWRVGMDPSFPPFEWLDDAGQPVGFDVALTEEIAAAWGMKVELVPIGFDSLLDALQTGKIDSVISALPYDERLTKDVAYSAPYFEAGIFLATRTETPMAGVEALANHTVGVEWGSMGDMVGRRLQ
jgi:ABC-type amino acid transport substrate-binding protein